MSRKEWLEERRKGIGGSDISSIIGINPYDTKLDVYLSKVKKLENKDNPRMRAGRILEPFVKELFTIQTKIKVKKPEKEIYIKNEIFRGSVDYEGEDFILECKTTSLNVNEIPIYYIAQSTWYCGIREKKGFYIAILVEKDMSLIILADLVGKLKDEEIIELAIKHFSFKIEYQKYDKSYFNFLCIEAEMFWDNHILKNKPPEAESLEDVMKLYEAKDNEIEATEEIIDKIEWMKDCKDAIKENTEMFNEAKMEVAEFLGNDTRIVNEGLDLITWNQSKDNLEFDTKKFKEENSKLFLKYCKNKKGLRIFLIK